MKNRRPIRQFSRGVLPLSLSPSCVEHNTEDVTFGTLITPVNIHFFHYCELRAGSRERQINAMFTLFAVLARTIKSLNGPRASPRSFLERFQKLCLGAPSPEMVVAEERNFSELPRNEIRASFCFALLLSASSSFFTRRRQDISAPFSPNRPSFSV